MLASSRISLDQFDQAFLEETEAAGHAVNGREVITLLRGEIRPRMVTALKTCKQYFKVACLTNNMKTDNESSDPFDTSAMREVYALFDAVIESRHLGIRKPDPRFYELACERMAVTPVETVFLDDFISNQVHKTQLVNLANVVSECFDIQRLAFLNCQPFENYRIVEA